MTNQLERYKKELASIDSDLTILYSFEDREVFADSEEHMDWLNRQIKRAEERGAYLAQLIYNLERCIFFKEEA